MFVYQIINENAQQWTPLNAVRDILGDENIYVSFDDDYDEDETLAKARGKYWITHSWTGFPLFSDMDCPPGEGCIGLTDPYSKNAKSIAHAVHEAYHALLHKRYKSHINEHLVNRLALSWLMRNMSGKDLQSAIEEIHRSQRSYKGKKYEPSRTWAKRMYPA